MRTTLTRRTAILGLALGCAGAGLAACSAPGGSSSSSAATGASGASGAIKVAIIDPQSGQTSSLGDWELKGAKLAIEEINAAGGVDGRQISFTLYDDQGDPTVATNLARKAVSEGAVAVLGSATSGNSLAMVPILEAAKVPEISSGQSPKLGQTGSKFIFLNAPPSTAIDESLAKYLVTTKSLKKIAMISNNGAYGKGEHDAFLASLKDLGVTPTSDQSITPDQKDFTSALTSIRGTNPDVLFIGAEEVESGLIAKQARQLGIQAVFAGGTPAATDIYVQTAGAAVADGTICSTPYLGNDTSDATKKFAAAYKAAYGKDPEFHGAKAYDGGHILADALKTTKGAGGQALADAIRTVKYNGLVGSFAFGENGVGVHDSQIGVIKNGMATPVS